MRSQIAAVVNLHREGSAAVPSLISAWRAVDAATKSGVATELVLVLDSPDADTTDLARQWEARGATVIVVDVADLGAARNAAAEVVDAEWVAFLDADDLWGEHWLTNAHAEATSAPPSPTVDVWHPQVNVIFGDHHSLLHHTESTSSEFSWARLRLHNAWTALCLVRTSHLLSLPYPDNDLDAGFGFEDWSWNTEVLRRGGRHRVVPNTCHFIRRRAASSSEGTLLHQSQHALRSPYRSTSDIVHLDAKRLPGATSRISDLSPTSPALPPTHRELPLALSDEILSDARLAATIEPAIARTVGTSAPPTLPQNLNTHVGPTQQALEELDLLAAASPFSSHAELIDQSERVPALLDADRARVIAEVLLDPEIASIPRGSSDLIDSAMAHFPQLRPTTW